MNIHDLNYYLSVMNQNGFNKMREVSNVTNSVVKLLQLSIRSIGLNYPLSINYHLPDATLNVFGLPEEGSSLQLYWPFYYTDLISGRYTEQQTTLFGESYHQGFEEAWQLQGHTYGKMTVHCSQVNFNKLSLFVYIIIVHTLLCALDAAASDCYYLYNLLFYSFNQCVTNWLETSQVFLEPEMCRRALNLFSLPIIVFVLTMYLPEFSGNSSVTDIHCISITHINMKYLTCKMIDIYHIGTSETI